MNIFKMASDYMKARRGGNSSVKKFVSDNLPSVSSAVDNGITDSSELVKASIENIKQSEIVNGVTVGDYGKAFVTTYVSVATYGAGSLIDFEKVGEIVSDVEDIKSNVEIIEDTFKSGSMTEPKVSEEILSDVASIDAASLNWKKILFYGGLASAVLKLIG